MLLWKPETPNVTISTTDSEKDIERSVLGCKSVSNYQRAGYESRLFTSAQ